MTKRVIAAAVLLLVSFAGMRAYGQTPTYLSTAYRPVESHAYTKVQDMLFGTMYMGGVRTRTDFTSSPPTDRPNTDMRSSALKEDSVRLHSSWDARRLTVPGQTKPYWQSEGTDAS